MEEVIRPNQHLFPVTTEVRLDKLKELLVDFPRADFAASLIRSFTEGFRPWAEPFQDDEPSGVLQPN
jgi:hypothetical protein